MLLNEKIPSYFVPASFRLWPLRFLRFVHGDSLMSFDHNTTLTLSVIPPVCSQEQCAVFMGVSKDTIRGLVEADSLPTVKIGRQRFINLSRLLADLQAGKTVFARGDYE